MPKLAIPISAAGAAAVLAPAWAQGQYESGPPVMWWAGGWFGVILGPLIMIVVLVLVIAAVVLVLPRVGGSGHDGAPPACKAFEILKERFARGEIDKEEFEERRRLLGD